MVILDMNNLLNLKWVLWGEALLKVLGSPEGGR